MQNQEYTQTVIEMMTILTRLSWPAEHELTKNQRKQSAIMLMPGYYENGVLLMELSFGKRQKSNIF